MNRIDTATIARIENDATDRCWTVVEASRKGDSDEYVVTARRYDEYESKYEFVCWWWHPAARAFQSGKYTHDLAEAAENHEARLAL